MHWLLNVRFEEDCYRIEYKTVQDNLSLSFSKIMPDCLLDSSRLLEVVCKN